MKRSEFLHVLSAAAAMTTLSSFRSFTDKLEQQENKLPVLFVGHGSPMNAIEHNEFSAYWQKMGKEIPKPAAVLCISAHWLSNGTKITAMPNPPTIHDFGGFPKALFDVQYPSPGSPELAEHTAKIITKTNVILDHDWGLDHGTWSIVKHMYPDADIPVLQLSIDYNKPAQYHYELAKELAALRRKGVLIIGSGNMVHNLGMVAWNKMNEPEYGYDWAIEMNTKFKDLIINRDHQQLINYQAMGTAAKNSIPTPEHYLPLIYTLGLQEKNDDTQFFNDKAVMGSITMTSVKFG